MPRGGWTGGKRACDLTAEEIRRVYTDTGANMTQACKALNCSRRILVQAMRLYGIPPKPKGEHGRGRPLTNPKLSDHDWLADQIKSRTFESIGRELGMSGSGVRTYAINHGLYEVSLGPERMRMSSAISARHDIKYVKITEEDIYRVYLNTDANIRKASRDLGCSYPTLIRAMEELGIPPKSHGRPTRRWTANSKDFPELDNPDWLKAEMQLHPKKHIANTLGTTVWNVDFHVRKHGLTSWESQYVPVENIEQLPRRRDREYMKVYLPSHPYADNLGFIFEHRVVLENKLGRYLGPDEVGHHLNERKRDNRPENLEALTRKEHARIHYQENADAKKELERVQAELDALKTAQQRTTRKVERLIVDNQLRMFEEDAPSTARANTLLSLSNHGAPEPTPGEELR